MDARLRELVAEGRSTGPEIAEILTREFNRELSRGALYDYASKHGVKLPGVERARVPKAPPKPKSPKAPKAPKAPKTPKAPPKAPPKPQPIGWHDPEILFGAPETRPPGSVTLLERTGCAWPVGRDEEGDALFCDAPRAGGGSYCTEHAERGRR